MKIQKLLELRSNPELNPKSVIFQTLKKFQESCGKMPNATKGGELISNGFISFTNLMKLGINPRSHFDTPNAIYAYDIDYVIEMLQDGKYLPKDSDIPYAADKPYFHTFIAKNPENLYVVGSSEHEEKLKAYIKGHNPSLYKYAYASDDEEATTARNTRLANKLKSHSISGEMAAQFAIIGGYFSSISKWSHFMRKAGFDGMIDLGYKVIHNHEPRQALFFSKDFIENETMEINKAQIMPDHPDVRRGMHFVRGTKSFPQFLNKTLNVAIFSNPEELENAIVDVGHSTGSEGSVALAVSKRLLNEMVEQFSKSLNVIGSRKIRIIKTAINLCRMIEHKIPPVLEKLYPDDAEVPTVIQTLKFKANAILEILTEHVETSMNIIALKNDIKVASLMLSAYKIATAGAKGSVELGRIFHELETHIGKFVDYEVTQKITDELQQRIDSVGVGEDDGFPSWYSWVIQECSGTYDSGIYRKINTIKNAKT